MPAKSVTVTTAAAVIADGRTGTANKPVSVVISNPSTSTHVIYVSDQSGVTAGTTAATDGFPIAAGGTFSIDLRGEQLYAIATGSQAGVAVFYIGNA